MVSTGTIEHKMLGVLSFKKGLSEGILDHGDSTIFLEDSKFKVLMDTVENIIGQTPAPEAIPQSSDDLEEKQPFVGSEVIETEIQSNKSSTSLHEQTFDGDDDLSDPLPEKGSNDNQQPEAGSPAELVQVGISFFSRLSETLTNPEATEKLISSLVQKDEADGKTYLKIPIESQKVVENAFALFAGLLGSLKK